MPQLSIVIALVNGPRRFDDLLKACGETDVEIIPVEADATRGRTSEREMRLEGMRLATGELVAVLGDRYELGENWLRSAFSESSGMISGCVAPLGNLTIAGWAIYLAEYSHVAPPMLRRLIEIGRDDLFPAGNVVYTRQAEPPATLCFDPELSVYFARPPSLSAYLVERFRESRQWAQRRRAGEHGLGRYLSALARVALPPLLIWRRARNVVLRRRYRWHFFKAIPYLTVFAIVEATGEIVGFLSGDVQNK